jgi:hypothetical protein
MNTYQFEGWVFYWIDFLLIVFFIIQLIKFLTLKNDIYKAGKNYVLFQTKMTVRMNKFIKIIVLFAIIQIIFSIVVSFFALAVLLLIFIIDFIILFIFNKKFNNVYGIYENGIIDFSDKLFEWKDIHSYIITDNNILGYYKNGNIFECKNVSNIEEIKCLFEKNRIKNREKE